MGWIILLVILALLGLVLGMPLRIHIAAQARTCTIQCHYGRFRLFEKHIAPKQDEPSQPTESSTEDAPAEDAPTVNASPEAAASPAKDASPAEDTSSTGDSVSAEHPASAADKPVPKDTPAPENEVSEAEDADDADVPSKSRRHWFGKRKAASAKERKRPKKPGFFQRMRPTSLSEGLDFVSDILASLSPPLRRLLRHMRLQKLSVQLSIGTQDAAHTAVVYGAASGAVFRLLGWLQAHMTVSAERVTVTADFLHPRCSYAVRAELAAAPGTLLAMGIGMGTRFLYRTWRRIRRQDHEKQLQAAETQPLFTPQPQQDAVATAID